MVMKRLVPLIALAASACTDDPQRNTASSTPAATDVMRPAQSRQSRPPKVVPMPKEQADLDRMILAGFTPHSDHLHPPGVKECPIAQGSEAVM
jgi:hypothetical protein